MLIKAHFRLLCLAIVLAPAASVADEYLELVVPLREGRFYSRRAILDECHRKLGTNQAFNVISDREMEITALDKAALLLASQAGLFKVRFEPGRLVLLLPDRQDEGVRRKIREQLGHLLGLSLSEWPAKLGLHVPPDLDPTRRTVLLIHGLEAGVAQLEPMRGAFEREGVQVLTFDFPNDGPIAWSGDRLSQDLTNLGQRHPQLKVVVVAHSMGGLVARYAVETPEKNPGCITDLFLVGTPNLGSRLSYFQPWMELVGEIAPRPLRLADALHDGLGEAADDLQPGSRFLTVLNGCSRTQGVRYYCVMGRKSFVIAQQRSAIEAELGQLADRGVISPARHRQLVALLNSDELRDGKGDGAVTLVSARLAGARGEKVFDLDHMELIAPPSTTQPGQGAAFTWIVTTLNWKGRHQ